MKANSYPIVVTDANGCEAVRSGTVLPTCGLVEPDARCDLPHVRDRAKLRTVGSALVNAFAFGGANCSLVVRRCD